MMLLTRLSLANRAIVALLSLLIVGVGLWATSTMKQELLPAIEQPTAVVVVTKAGASPATLDKQVVVPLAQALEAVSGVDDVTSTTSNGSAQVTVTWAFGGDGSKIIADVDAVTKTALASAPSGVTSTVIDGSTGDIPVLALGLTSDDSIETFAERVDSILVPAIKKVPGVRGVEVAGRTQERVLVTLDPAALVAFKIDQATVGALLRTAGTVVPAGTSVEGEQSLAIEVGQENATLADIASMPIPALAGPVLLSQVAAVALVPVDQSSLSRVDGRPSIGLTITKTPDANAVQVSHAVAAVVAAQVADLGTASASHTIFDQSTMVEKSIHDLSVEGGLGLLFAILIILVFLLSPRATIITAISIPLSLLIAIIGLRLGGLSLNIFTLAALTVAVGRVVDDSIVVIENIVRRRGDTGLTPDGVRASVAQVAGAVTASTLTTVAVFLPVAFVGGIAGELFRPFAVTVAVALLASLIVSLTIVPVLAYWFLRKPKASAQRDEHAAPAPVAEHVEATTRMQRAYLPALAFALRRPILMVVVAVLVFGGSLVGAGSLKTDLLGGFSDARAVQVQQKMPVTATLASGDVVAAGLEKSISSVSEVESYQTTVGMQGAPVRLDLVLTADADPEAAMRAIRKAVDDLPRAEDITVQAQATQTTSSTIDVLVKGNNEVDLAAAATSISERLGTLDKVSAVTTDLAGDQPLLKVAVDQSAAAAQGFTTAEVGAAIAAAVEGERLGTVSVDGVTHDLVLRSQQTDTTPAAIGALPLPVSAVQQQRAQKTATDAATQEQENAAAAARAEANRQAANQVSELVASRAKAVADVAALRGQLASLIANPPPADPAPVTAGELAAVPYEQLVVQLSAAIDGAASGIDGLDEQIKTARKAIADGQVQQAETERLAQLQRDIENVRATPLLVSDLAAVEVVNAPSTITRSNGERVVTVSVTPKAGDLGGATEAINAAVATIDLPDGVSLDQGGAAEDQSASFMQLGLAMVVALALVYIVLVATFRSLLQPLLLLVSVPLAATGAIVGLLVTGTPLGIPALIGMLMLIGIVVTNAIVLIDLINEYRREGASIDDSVTHGSRLRLRPIIMTACATVFALLPMALGLTGGGAFISKSLAIVVIGGLLSSTVLTLLVVPAIYVLQHRGAERRKARRDHTSERVATDQAAVLAGEATVEKEPAGEGDRGRMTT
ncbi:efflux RND transporter permease subunit [Agreia sp. VKM Ac-1783]|uniref:efflux RND transporter permease subunit n=1 Tax=Agreia sp. VKM Ac-1783 TaxID=1938889 RepID=UPI000A2AD74B|nr:efflux RND transporter permease subunit [Agreia sp. VKM Ac-1783]SMQ60978.1 hydrophobic/amphiphilic exporter-1, HAE1 family [Agreia sp. VKM Ac-1783]